MKPLIFLDTETCGLGVTDPMGGRRHPPGRRGNLEVCPPPAEGVKPGEEACPVCWLIHPKGECDR